MRHLDLLQLYTSILFFLAHRLRHPISIVEHCREFTLTSTKKEEFPYEIKAFKSSFV